MSRWGRRIAASAAILCLALSAVLAVKVVRADWAFFRAEKSAALFRDPIGQRDIRQRDLKYLNDASAGIRQALAIWPDNPRYLALAAQLHLWQGLVAATVEGETRIDARFYQQSLQMLREAATLNPSHARTWALLAEYKALAGERDAELHQAREKALALGGANPDLVEKMLSL